MLSSAIRPQPLEISSSEQSVSICEMCNNGYALRGQNLLQFEAESHYHHAEAPCIRKNMPECLKRPTRK